MLSPILNLKCDGIHALPADPGSQTINNRRKIQSNLKFIQFYFPNTNPLDFGETRYIYIQGILYCKGLNRLPGATLRVVTAIVRKVFGKTG